MKNTKENAFNFYKEELKKSTNLKISDIMFDYANKIEQEQFESITNWQNETFGKATPLSKVYHLLEEVEELKEAIKHGYTLKNLNMELADCFILLFGITNSLGYDYQKLKDIIDAKMKINKLRKWRKADKNGVVKHID